MNCLIINQLATPGLGSWLGGRKLAACGQLLLAMVGFFLTIAWFVQFTLDLFRQLNDAPMTAGHYAWQGKSGFTLLIAAWLWSLFTSLSLLREARRNEAAPRASGPDGT